MANSLSQTLSLPGADIVYSSTDTTSSTKPILILIPGANGTASIFTPLASYLSAHYNVITYDRRGFSRSKLTSTQDYTPEIRQARDADDVGALLSHLSPSGKPSYVLGSSSGAIVASSVLRRHSDKIQKLILHEPPFIASLPENVYLQIKAKWDEIYHIYESQGLKAGIDGFVSAFPLSTDTDLMRTNMNKEENASNVKYWFQNEFLQYTNLDPQVEELKMHGKLAIALGEATEGPLEMVAKTLAAQVGTEVKMVPGGHVAYVLEPEEFAVRVRAILEE